MYITGCYAHWHERACIPTHLKHISSSTPHIHTSSHHHKHTHTHIAHICSRTHEYMHVLPPQNSPTSPHFNPPPTHTHTHTCAHANTHNRGHTHTHTRTPVMTWSTHFTEATSANRSSSFNTGGPLHRKISESGMRPTTSWSPSDLACVRTVCARDACCGITRVFVMLFQKAHLQP
jgi:hypothetical protein